MKYWTWAEIKEKVENDIDIESNTTNDFVSPTELVGYANEAIDEAESEIHGLYEDYFLADTTLTITSGTDEYELDTAVPDIYANKIREIMYVNGTVTYPIRRSRQWHKIANYESEKALGVGTVYEYLIVNRPTEKPTLVFTPPIRETGPYVKIWYLRNARRLIGDVNDATDICDIPEFIHFIMAFMRWKCLLKEGHGNAAEAFQELEMQRQKMNSTLAGMVVDNDNTIEPDFTHYREHS